MTELHKNEAIILFADAKIFAKWLKINHAKSKGIWLKLAKKNSDEKSVSYGEALDEALCWGWIDGQKASYDESWWLQRFCPRSPRSIWSKINVAKVAALTEAGRMQQAGLRQVEIAQENGQWDRAYDGSKNMKPTPELIAALAANPQAEKFFAKLNSADRYAILHRLHMIKKAETRDRRIQSIVAMLGRGETLKL